MTAPATLLERVSDVGTPPGASLLALPSLAALAAPGAYMARHSRSFRFAATFMSRADRDRIARVYAWCRFVDDLADTPGDASLVESHLDAWMAWSQAAYRGASSGIPLIDEVMGEMARRGVPFRYAGQLACGVRSDVRFIPFRDLEQLRVYAHRVAGVVGQWLTELHGVDDPWMLERAAALGRAMQVTNIVRDVGEDWDRGRLYLPRTMLAQRGVTAEDIGAMRAGRRPITDAYRALLEDLMGLAERDYAAAREAIPGLPSGFRRAVAVAAAVYEGIHEAVRRNGHDNLRVRAVTGRVCKLVLAAGALRQLRVRRSRSAGA